MRLARCWLIRWLLWRSSHEVTVTGASRPGVDFVDTILKTRGTTEELPDLGDFPEAPPKAGMTGYGFVGEHGFEQHQAPGS